MVKLASSRHRRWRGVPLGGPLGVGAVVWAILWTLFAWSGRWYDWLLSFVTPLGLASITTCTCWLLGWV